MVQMRMAELLSSCMTGKVVASPTGNTPILLKHLGQTTFRTHYCRPGLTFIGGRRDAQSERSEREQRERLITHLSIVIHLKG